MSTIEINGLTLELPKQPPKSKMINYGVSKKDQVWTRQETPQFMEDFDPFNPTDEQSEYIDQEIDRILTGVWILINGEPTWISGPNYFFLNFWRLQEGVYPTFRQIDREFFLWWEICCRYKRCLGTITGKYRRQGASSRGSCLSVYIAITETNVHNGTISKTGGDSSFIFQDMIVAGFKSLPTHIKPQSSGSDKAVKELVIARQSERMTKDKRIVGDSYGLNSKISHLPTAINSYDGKRLRYLFGDEFAKFPRDVPAWKYWQVVKRCLMVGTKRVGMAYIPSTVNEASQGGDEFQKMWRASNHMKNGFDGTTESGLFKYFIPCYHGYTGFTGKYGESIIETPTPEQVEWLKNDPDCPNPYIGAKEYHEKERNKLADDAEALSEYIRQHPFTEEEQFYGSVSSSIINPLLANQQLARLDSLNIPRRKGEFYRDLKDDLVKFRDTSSGPWELIWDFPDFSMSNKSKIVYGKKVPTNPHLFSIGCDPFASAQGVAYGEGSKGIAYIKRHYTPMDEDNSDLFIGRLNYRPVFKNHFHEQVFMAGEYFGCYVAYEDKFDDFVTYAVQEKLENYMLKAPDNLVGARAKMIKYGVPTNSHKAIEYHTNAIKNDFHTNHHKYYFKELIQDYMIFDPTSRTIHDDSMAAGFTLICEINCLSRNIVPQEQTTRKPFLKKYSYSGRI